MSPAASARRSLHRSREAGVAIAAALAILAVAGCTSSSGPSSPGATSATATTSAPTTGEASAGDVPALVQKTEPSVVTVRTAKGLGSGVVYKSDGTIVTDAHVVAGATAVKVAFADCQPVSVTVRAGDPVSDVAVLQADRKNLPAASFETTLPPVGALAIVLGSPLGFENTVTSGIISGLHRDLPASSSTGAPLVDLMQTDAPISPGNSGGAVRDGRAESSG